MTGVPNPATTIDDGYSRHAPEPEPGLTLTILWHPDASRIGQTAFFGYGRQRHNVRISRDEPTFGDGDPLDDTGTSRSPLELVPRPDGSVVLWPARPKLKWTIDGLAGQSGQVIDAARLDRGFRLALGGRGPLLWVRSGWHHDPTEGHGLIGTSRETCAVRAAIERFGPTPFPVLVEGPTGTGKELVSRALHAASHRANRPLRSVSLATMIGEMALTRLFGHQKGAFTVHPRSGQVR